MKEITCFLLALCLMMCSLTLTSCETIATLKDKLGGEEESGEVNKPDDQINSCHHRFTQLPWSAPTCTKEGVRGGFECTKCHKIYIFSREENGLVEVDSLPTVPMIEHSMGNEYALTLKNGVSSPRSFSDYEVVTHCVSCNVGFTRDTAELKSFAPSTKLLYNDKTPVPSRREIVDGLVSTTYTFPSSTEVGIDNWVYHNSDSGELNANTKVPFTAGNDRLLLILVKNSSSEDVSFRYGAEYFGTYCWSDEITVAAGSYAAFTLKIFFSGSDYACYHSIRLTHALQSEAKMSFSGFYFE